VGQKTNPVGFRLGVNRTWDSKWFSKKNYARLLEEDLMIRKYIKSKMSQAGIAKIGIEREPQKVTVNIHTARPGMVIGRKGSEVDKLRDELHYLTKKSIFLNIKEVKKPELNAQLVAEHIAQQLRGRVSHRRVMKKTLASAMRMGAQGIKVKCKGRIGGSEMGRVESYHEGRVPLHTLRANIDFARATSHTKFGTIGVKVWLYLGEIFPKDFKRSLAEFGRTEEM
jgi:small subunit ribosomal protein S3